MKAWFKITNDAVTDSATVIIFGDIEPVTARDFVEQFKKLAEKDLTVRINSYGGDFFSALAIYNLLRAHRRKVEIIVDGICASAATVIACGGRTLMPSNSWMMVHSLSGWPEEETIRQVEQSLIDAYVQKTKLSEQRIRELVAAATWMNAEVAHDLGFADEIIEPVALAARAELSKFQNLPEALKSIAASAAEPGSPPSSVPAPTITKPEAAIIAKAQALVKANEEQKLRASVFKDAAAIIQACADAGHPDLVAGFLDRGLSLEEVKAELAKPKNIESATANGSPEETKRIVALCFKAGVPELAERFLDDQRTVAWVENRLRDSDQIRGRCVAAKRPERANAYIKAGMSVQEVGAHLLEIMIAMQGPEIDNHLSPDMVAGLKPETPYNNSNGRGRVMSTAEVYALRNRRPDGNAKKIIAPSQRGAEIK
jgi:ATP-dependent Clp protease protease subunit